MSTFAVTLAANVNADAGNPILGTITATSTFNADGTVTVNVRGEWNWLSHNSDCNFDRAGAGVAIIWNDPTETGYTISHNGVTAQVGIQSKNGSWADPNALDQMVHPSDLGNVPEGYTAAGTDYPTGQQFANPSSNNPADFASWFGGCGREPLTATASKTGGASCGDGTADCSGRPWGSWGYDVNGGLGYSHTFRTVTDISTVCANFYDVHGGGKAGSKNFQVPGGSNEITVDKNGDNSIQTNAFNVSNGANCITVAPPKLIAKKVVDKTTANPGDTLTYTITVQNTIGSPVSGVNIGDDISPVVPSHGTFGTSTPAATITGGNQLSWSNQTIPALSTSTYTYTVVLNSSGWPSGTTTLPNVVVVTDSNCAAGSTDPKCGTTTTVSPQPHLTVVKTPDAQTVVAGNPVGFTMTATSDGAASATGVTLSDALPTLANAGINWSISPANASCSIAGAAPTQTLSCNFGTLAVGASASVHVTSPTTAPPAGTSLAACAITTQTFATNLNNTVNVTSTNASSATANAGTCVTGTPHVSVVKTADNATVVAGNPVGFTMTVTSDGIGTASNVTLSDPLPTLTGLGINWSNSPAYSGPGTCGITGAAPSQTLNCSFGNLAQGSSASVHVTSTTTAPGAGTTIAACQVTVATYATNLDNTVSITSSNAGSATSQTGVCVTGNPHITVVKTPDAQTVLAGNPVGFTMTVTSDGVGTANSVNLSDPLPTLAGLGINWTISPAVAGCSISGAAPSQTLNCSFGNLAQGSSASVHVTSNTMAPPAGTTIAPCQVTVTTFATNLNNSVQVTSSNAASSTAQTGVCITGNPHVSVVKTPDAQTVVAGNPVGFTMTVTSDGTGTASNVTLSDPLPTLTGLGINWTISPAVTGCSISGSAPSQTLNCSFGSLAQGASASVHVSTNTTAPGAGTTIAPCQVTVTTFTTNLNNTVSIASSNAGSATAQTGICVTNTPHITVVKTPDAQTVVAGNPVGFTITVTSDGVGTANNVTLNDALPNFANVGINWSISPAYAGLGTCSITGSAPTQVLTCSLGNMASGSSTSVHVLSPTAAPPAGSTIPPCQVTVTTYATNLNNSVTITSANAASSTAQTGVCVTGTPHITVTKTPDAQTVLAGNPVGFTITVTSDGVGAANNVSVSDPLPTLAGVGINWAISPTYGGPGTCSIIGGAPSQILGCAIGTLAQGSSASVHLTSQTTAPASGTTISPCQVTSTTYATNLNNAVQVTSSNAASSTAQTGVCVTSSPHVTVVKTPDAQSVLAGSPVGFTITVTSDGIGTATGVTLTDALPTLANTGINWSISPAYAGPGTCSITGSAPTQVLACSLGDMASGSSASVHVTSATTAPPVGTTIAPCQTTVATFATNLNNQVQVTSSNAASSTAQTGTCVSINPNPAIHIVKVATPTLLPVGGGLVVYTYSVTNTGNVPLTNVIVVDDKCSPVVFVGGDTNANAALDLTETWAYTCTANITVTTTNTATATGHYIDPSGVDHLVTAQAQATVVVPTPTPTPTGSVKGATSPPKPHVTLPPTDTLGSTTGDSNSGSGTLMILILLAGIMAAVPVLVLGKRREQDR
ncbi:MAG TPA: hypothetical protein VNF73_02015 [Candidatus Saccharimonadales bacterium]|nr:hypothetical protein [Candidatus Saccharimonadales bacterium]